jgi:hypothetical protein
VYILISCANVVALKGEHDFGEEATEAWTMAVLAFGSIVAYRSKMFQSTKPPELTFSKTRGIIQIVTFYKRIRWKPRVPGGRPELSARFTIPPSPLCFPSSVPSNNAATEEIEEEIDCGRGAN